MPVIPTTLSFQDQLHLQNKLYAYEFGLEKIIELNKKSIAEKELSAKFKIMDESDILYRMLKKLGDRASAIWEKYLSGERKTGRLKLLTTEAQRAQGKNEEVSLYNLRRGALITLCPL